MADFVWFAPMRSAPLRSAPMRFASLRFAPRSESPSVLIIMLPVNRCLMSMVLLSVLVVCLYGCNHGAGKVQAVDPAYAWFRDAHMMSAFLRSASHSSA